MRLWQAGADEVLVKPINPNALIWVVEKQSTKIGGFSHESMSMNPKIRTDSGSNEL
jgi:DNA-binding response OmpR family regulator